MTLTEFFNPYSVVHLKAYRHLEKKGSWPPGFIPEGMDTGAEIHWRVALVAKMANAWLEHAEAGRIIGMPYFDQ